MARYFFDITDADGTVVDEVGQLLPTTEAAIDEALIALLDIAKEEIGIKRSDTLLISVRNDEDHYVVRSRLTLTMEVHE